MTEKAAVIILKFEQCFYHEVRLAKKKKKKKKNGQYS